MYHENRLKQGPFFKQIKSILDFRSTSSKSLSIDSVTYDVFLNDISQIFDFAFDQDFIDFATQVVPGFSLMQAFCAYFQNSNALYEAYCDKLDEENGLTDFLDRFPLLNDLSLLHLNQSKTFWDELNYNILIDEINISNTFNNGQPLGKIIGIELNAGDKHQSGKSTAIVQFQCGLKVVYKPRSGKLDIAFDSFLQFFGSLINVSFRSTIFLDRDNYFWMEFLENISVKNDYELNQYYLRCGVLLCVCFVLCGTDFHYENIIACGEFPVLIDIECLFAAAEITDSRLYTVYNTGLVPLNMFEGKAINPVDSSGFGASQRQKSSSEYWTWRFQKTDAMRLEKVFGDFFPEKNQPIYKGNKVSPEFYNQFIIRGFKHSFQWIILNKYNFCNNEDLLLKFRNMPFRVLLRNTSDYRSITNNSLIPKALKSQQSRDSEIWRALNEFFTVVPLTDRLKKQIFQKELDVINKLNIPLFVANTTELMLYESDEIVCEHFFNQNPYNVVLKRVSTFTMSDMNRQINLIESAFAVRYNLPIQSFPHTKFDNDILEFSHAIISNEILKISNQIKLSALAYDGFYYWHSYVSNKSNSLVYDTTGDSFYDGSLGIYYFLSLCDNLDVLPKNKISEEITDGLRRQLLSKLDMKNSQYEDLSFSTGIGGIIYAIINTADQDKSVLIAHAVKLTTLITSNTIAADNKIDIMSGSAGLLLSLCTLYKLTLSENILKLMISLGDHILEKRKVDLKTGILFWESELLANTQLGFSHGSIGISHALLHLYEITGAIKFKRPYYDSLQMLDFYHSFLNNPVEKTSDGGLHSSEVSWCHGEAGLGLSYLKAYSILQDNKLLIRIKESISRIINYGVQDFDTYCCGNCGRIDFLIEAGVALNQPELISTAKSLVLKIINAKNKKGFYETYHKSGISLENPSLFRGISGIGYTFLRSVNPTKYPCLGAIC